MIDIYSSLPIKDADSLSWSIVLYRCVALLIACTNCAFHLELSEEEYRGNHPQFPNTVSFTSSSLTWETFDKDNTPQPFHCTGATAIEFLAVAEQIVSNADPCIQTTEPIRDKSPPAFLSLIQ